MFSIYSVSSPECTVEPVKQISVEPIVTVEVPAWKEELKHGLYIDVS